VSIRELISFHFLFVTDDLSQIQGEHYNSFVKPHFLFDDQASMHLHLRAADKHGDSVSALCWRGRDRALPLGTRRGLGWPVAAGRRRAGDGGEGVTAAAVALGGGVRSGLWAAATSMAAVLGSRGGGSRTGADEKPSVRRRAKEEGNIWGGAFCPG